MHVGFSLLTLFPGRVGGSETVVRELLGAFRAGPAPDRLTLLGNRHLGDDYAGWPVRQVSSYRPGDRDVSRFLAMNVGRMHPRLDGREFDVVHYPATVPVPKFAGVPRVVTVHDVQHRELPHLFSGAERWLRGWAYDDAARRADRVITVSEHAKTGIVNLLGVSPERVVVIAHGVDHGRFKPDGQARDDLGDYVLYPANAWPHKNHDRLLTAWDQVDGNLTLVLTGQTYGRTFDRPRVRHLGHVPHADLPALYRGARAVVFPSLFEGFGAPVLEAMASGTPVATSDRGALAELAADAALTFDPDDCAAIAAAVTRVSTDATLRKQLRARGIARSSEFTWTRSAEEHLAAYRAVVTR